MGVAVVGAAVCRPPGVTDAGRPRVQRVVGHLLLEVVQLAGLAGHLEPAVAVQDGDARAVVAAVLQPAQPIHDHIESLLMTDVAHNAAHGPSLAEHATRSRRTRPAAPTPARPRTTRDQLTGVALRRIITMSW